MQDDDATPKTAAKKAKPSYLPRPSAEPSVLSRLDVIMRVHHGDTTMVAGATELGLSRVQLQNLHNQALAAMIEALTPKPGGRPKKDQPYAELERENAQLKKELHSVQRELEITRTAMLSLVDVVKTKRTTSRHRARTSSSKKPIASPTNEAAEDDRSATLPPGGGVNAEAGADV